MEQVTIIGIDISKRSFQLHGATAEGLPVFRKKLSRGKFLAFLSEVPPCLIVMEACGGAHRARNTSANGPRHLRGSPQADEHSTAHRWLRSRRLGREAVTAKRHAGPARG